MEKFTPNKIKSENSEILKKLLLMYEKAPEAKIYIDKLAEHVAEKYEGLVLKTNLKSFEDSLQKIKLKGDDYVNSVIDIARNTIVVEKDHIIDAYEDLFLKNDSVKQYRIKKADNPETGYIGSYTRIKCPNGLVAEIQFSTPEMICAKEEKFVAEKLLGSERYNKILTKAGIEGGLGHNLYKKLRALKKGSDEYKELLKISREYYSRFY